MKKRPIVNWNPGTIPAKKKILGRSSHVPVSKDKTLDSLFPYLQPGRLFTIQKECTGSVLDLDERQVLVIFGPEYAAYTPVTSPALILPEGISALYLGESSLKYKSRGAVVNRTSYDFLIGGRRWTITDLEWVKPIINEEND